MNQNDSKFLCQIKPSILKKSPVFLRRPKLIGYYNYNYEQILAGKTIKYFKEPKDTDYPMDLNVGFDSCRFRRISKETDSRLRLPLEYAMSKNITDSDCITVYTSRRALTKILEFPYCKYDFTIQCSRYMKNIYIAGELSADQNYVTAYHHLRLSQAAFADSPDESPKVDDPIDENVSFACLHQTNMGKFKILYGGEVQGIIADKKLDCLDDMDELDKCRFVFTKQMWDKPRVKEYKFIIYWIQSYLAGVDDIYVAYKNSSGIVKEPMEHVKVSTIPKKYMLEPAVCLGTLNEVMEKILEMMSNVNSLDTVYELHFNANTKSVHYTIYPGRTDKTFIPKSYADFITK